MDRTLKTRIYPTDDQKALIEKTFGCARFIYNTALERQIELHSQNKKFAGKYEMCRWIKEIKIDNGWLYDVDNSALQLSLASLESAYKKFFKGAGFPKFKNKRKNEQSYSTTSCVHVFPHFVRIPRAGKIYTHELLDDSIVPNKITISRKAGLYFASIQYDDGKSPAEPNGNPSIGIDLGIKDLAILSDGTKIPNPQHMKKHEKKIKHLQRELCRKTNGSNRYNKSVEKLSRAYLDLANCRKDYLHKATTMITKSYGYVAIEDLAINNLVKNHNLAKAIYDCGWYEFRRQLEYKAKWYGSEIKVIGRFEPSSKMCSACGAINKELTLKDREWTCECGERHDRDLNAAKNILAFSYAPMGSREVYVENEKNLRKQAFKEA
jgi:putative transposase